MNNDRYGRWIVLGPAPTKNKGRLYYCKCDCGTEKIIPGIRLRAGISLSCGCLQKDTATKHGMEGTPTYKSWDAMKGRCLRKNNASYKNYGAKGITICSEWMIFENFLKDMGVKPDGTSIDRKDGTKGYYKDNCRWATQKEQDRNQRNNIVLTLNGVSKLLLEWSEEYNWPRYVMANRRASGWSDQRILTTPWKKMK